MSSVISLEQIQDIEKKRKEIKKEIYKKIYEQFNKKIKTCVELGHKQVVLRVPGFLLGYPVYDVQKAGDYLQRQFELANFIVHRMSYQDIYISWKLETIKNKSKIPSRNSSDDYDSSLTSLMNLKKTAGKYKSAN